MNPKPSVTPAPLPGRATITGTETYADRFAELHPGHFRLCHGLIYSSIGLGTYLGDADDATDQRYFDSILQAITSGCNVIDTAINYRFQRSERIVGKALQAAVQRGFSREEIILCSKGGYIPFDGSYPPDPYQWIEENLLLKGIVTPEELHPAGHCIAPMYLRHQLHQSLENLQVECIDVYYIHNPETQLSELNEARFYEAIEMAFRMMENCVQSGKIGVYGFATWDGFLDEGHNGTVMQLEKIEQIARRAGGDQHHFRMVQLPVNLGMTDALNAPIQLIGDRKMTLLEAACALNICVIGSASLLQANLTRNLPVTLQQAIPGFPTDATRALQFARSVPGITTALAGMSKPAHVTENLDIASAPPMGPTDFNILFGER